MKYSMILIILTLFSCSCGQGVRNTGEYEPLVKEFEKDSETVYGQPLHISAIDIVEDNTLPDKILAQCVTDPFLRAPKILINPTFWKDASSRERLIVMYHELGHCILNRKHNDEEVYYKGFKRWKSIMNTYPLVIQWNFEEERIEYIKELFGET